MLCSAFGSYTWSHFVCFEHVREIASIHAQRTAYTQETLNLGYRPVSVDEMFVKIPTVVLHQLVYISYQNQGCRQQPSAGSLEDDSTRTSDD